MCAYTSNLKVVCVHMCVQVHKRLLMSCIVQSILIGQHLQALSQECCLVHQFLRDASNVDTSATKTPLCP